MQRQPVAIVGSNISALVSAISCARQGLPVVMIGSRKHFGGHFSGMVVEDARFDVGMLFFEFTSFKSEPGISISTYEDEKLGDAGRFVSTIRDFVDSLGIKYNVAEMPKMIVEERLLDDIFISNRLAALNELSTKTRQAILEETTAAVDRDERHPARKADWPVNEAFNLEEISTHNHGQTFHRLFMEPMCQKLTGLSTKDLAAKYHRLSWLPLYYPETLSAQLSNQPQPLPETRFHYPEDGFHILPESLKAAVSSLDIVEWLDDEIGSLETKNGGFRLGLSSGREIEVRHLAWTLDSDKLLELGLEKGEDNSDYAFLGIVFARIKAAELGFSFSTLCVADQNYCMYRISNQTASSGRKDAFNLITIEVNCDFMEGSRQLAEDEIHERIVRDLKRLGVIKETASSFRATLRKFKKALLLPTVRNFKTHEAKRDRCRELFPGIHLIGSCAPFGAASLNDQILQGMSVAARLD
jgi:protoporphyrinogen oxidase